MTNPINDTEWAQSEFKAQVLVMSDEVLSGHLYALILAPHSYSTTQRNAILGEASARLYKAAQA